MTAEQLIDLADDIIASLSPSEVIYDGSEMMFILTTSLLSIAKSLAKIADEARKKESGLSF